MYNIYKKYIYMKYIYMIYNIYYIYTHTHLCCDIRLPIAVYLHTYRIAGRSKQF